MRDVFLQLASVQVNPRESAQCRGHSGIFLEKHRVRKKKKIHFSDFPKSRIAYGTFYSRKRKKSWLGPGWNGGAPRQAEDILRGRINSHTEALLIRKKKEEKKFCTNYTGQAKP